jgi:hypothetical protein
LRLHTVTARGLSPVWRRLGPGGGPEGNERLTSTVALVLVILLVVEAATTLALHSYLPVHIFLGLLLLPPVALKLASTGWRFVRYYTGSAPYRLKGPPELWLRLLAPLLIASTVVLFGTGVAFLVAGRGGGLLLSVHAVSFGIWGVLMIVHVLAYLTRVLRHGLADWRPAIPGHGGPGRRCRRRSRYILGASGVAIPARTRSPRSRPPGRRSGRPRCPPSNHRRRRPLKRRASPGLDRSTCSQPGQGAVGVNRGAIGDLSARAHGRTGASGTLGVGNSVATQKRS